MFDVILPSREVTEFETSQTERCPVAPTTDFSLQRSRGRLDLSFATRHGISYADRTFQQGALKIRFPNVVADAPPEAVIVNTAGGLAGDDRLDIRLSIEQGAKATLSSQACEKVYRALENPAHVVLDINLEAQSHLDWLPQPMIFFDGARLRRQTRITMSAEAHLFFLEGMIFGRAAMGETVSTGELSDTLRIMRDGRLIHLDRFDLHGDMAACLARKTVLANNLAMATLRYVAPDAEVRLADMRVALEGANCPVAASAWNGMLVMRCMAPDSYILTRELMRVLSAFRQRPMPRVWTF